MRASVKFFWAVAVPFITACLLSNSYAQTEESPLKVNFAYAQDKIQKGDVWKVYLSVTDPEGMMKKVWFTIDEPGGQRYRPSFRYLKKGMEKEFAGYFALHTASPRRNLSGAGITLNLSISDGKGNVRGSFSFPLEFDGQAIKPLPPEKEKELNQRIGIIDIDLNVPDSLF